MQIGSPSFAVSFGLEEVKKLIAETLKKKDWHTFKHGDITLSFVPHYTFYYDAFTEEQTDKGKKITETKRGALALNAVSGEIDKEVSKELEKIGLATKLPEVKAKFQKPAMDKAEAKSIAEIKTAAFLASHPEKLVISNLKIVFYPLWTLGIEVEEGNFELHVSGTNGKVFGEEKIPWRKKGLIELTTETLSELKSPAAWGKYTVETGKTITGSRTLRKMPLLWLIVIILAIIVVVALVAL